MRERYDTIKIRLPRGYKARLQRLAESDGYSVAEWITTWIEIGELEAAEAEQFGRRPSRRAPRSPERLSENLEPPPNRESNDGEDHRQRENLRPGIDGAEDVDDRLRWSGG